MLRKILCLALLLVTVGEVQAVSFEELLPGDILVSQMDGEIAVGDGEVELCRAGDLTEGGYILAEEFGGGFISMEEVPSPDFAMWMSHKSAPGIIRSVDGHGVVRFAAMEPGLYLVRQRRAAAGYYAFRPYLVSVNGEMTLVDTYPVMEKDETIPGTAEPNQPYLGALGIALTLTGFLFWDEARKRETGNHL